MSNKERLKTIQFTSEVLRFLRDNGKISSYTAFELPDLCAYIVDHKLANASGDANVVTLVIDGYNEFRSAHTEVNV